MPQTEGVEEDRERDSPPVGSGAWELSCGVGSGSREVGWLLSPWKQIHHPPSILPGRQGEPTQARPRGAAPDFGSRGPDSPVTLEIMSPELQLLRVVDEVRPRDSVVALLGTPHQSEDDFRQRGSNFKTLNNPVFTFTVTVYLCPPAVVRWVLFKINSLL